MPVSRREQVHQEGFSVAINNERCSLGISMGVGKTKIGLDYVDYFKPAKVLVVAPKVSIFETWKEEAAKHGIEHLLPSMEFTTYRSICKHDPGEYDMLILDECHSLLDTHRPFLELFEGRILGLTGTPPKRHDSEKGQMVREFCPVMYEYLVSDAVEEKILNDYRITVHLLDLDIRKNITVKLKNGGEFYTSEWESYNYWTTRIDESTGKAKQIASVMRMRTMMEFPSKERYGMQLLNSTSDKTIIFANTQAQADRLCPHTYHSGNSNSEYNLELFQKGEINKLSTVLQLVEGVNVSGLKVGIVLHTYSGNSPKTLQRMGRLLRLSPDDVCHLHLLCYRGTVDVKWIREVLDKLNPEKIKYWNVKEQRDETEFFNQVA